MRSVWSRVLRLRKPAQHWQVDPEKFLDDLNEHQFGSYDNEKQRLQDFKATFGTPHGRRVLYMIMLWGGVFSTSEGSLERAEGRREIAIKILHILNARVEESEDGGSQS